MVPPALTEVRQNVLPGKLHYLVQDAPEVAYPEISHDEGGQEPIDPVDHEVMVHLIPHMLESELAVLIVRVHLFGYRLVELGIEEAEDLSAALWALPDC